MSSKGLLAALVSVVALAALWAPASASHHVNPDWFIAPFSGRWADASNSFTWPQNHPLSYGGDWSTDYYAFPGTQGDFRIDPTAGSASGTIERFQSACGNPALYAGYQYRIRVNNSQMGSRGWVTLAHVDPVDPATGTFFWWGPPGSGIPRWAHVGWTYQFSNSSCYQVNNPSGVHWHIEGYQDSHYACFDNWGAGASLTFPSRAGLIGSNKTGVRQAC